MWTASKLRLLAGTAIALTIVNPAGIDLQSGVSGRGWIRGDRVEAQSGGRSRGGSFSRPSGGSAPSRSAPSAPTYAPRPNAPTYVPGPVYVGPSYGVGYGSPFGGIGFIFLLAVLGFMVMPIIMAYLKTGSRGSGGGFGSSELENDTVTVTRLQVALLAQARYIQSALTETVLNYNPDTPEGRSQQLQETVLALLRSPENWTHARTDSQAVRGFEAATQQFEKLSLEERSKFDTETLVRVGANVRRQTLNQKDDDPASYIVVTLLLGTADDKPLIGRVHDAEELRAALQRIGSIPPEYLMVFELLWSPQEETDNLSRDELLTHYPDLVQIA